MDTVEQVVTRLALQPHPEGGFYRETWRSEATLPSGRALATGILFLLPGGDPSRWHRTDGEEIWIYQGGDPLTLSVHDQDQSSEHLIGMAHAPQAVVPAHAWQSARSEGDWTLVCCIVSPGFEFETFEMAPPGWEPTGVPSGDLASH
ncbi:MAG: cupin domain-containing protein [Phycisphaerales bacterium]|nr:cupin domain-containing protein [Phycisphaerales bacterium]